MPAETDSAYATRAEANLAAIVLNG